MPQNLDGCWIIMLSMHLPNFIAEFWHGGKSQYDRWRSCSTKVLTNISFLLNIISNSTFFHAHATKFGWVLDYYVVNAYAEFHCQILSRERITIRHVRELQYYVFDYYFSTYEFLTWSVFLCSCHQIFNGCWTMVSLMYMPSFTNIFWQGGKLGICRMKYCPTFCLLSQWM